MASKQLCDIVFEKNGVLWVHCHHGMARPRFSDRADGL
jgi:exosome complex RNA-binding protein Rrp4